MVNASITPGHSVNSIHFRRTCRRQYVCGSQIDFYDETTTIQCDSGKVMVRRAIPQGRKRHSQMIHKLISLTLKRNLLAGIANRKDCGVVFSRCLPIKLRIVPRELLITRLCTAIASKCDRCIRTS